MHKYLLLLAFLCLTSILPAQENRSYDGSNNNFENPTWGATHTPLKQRVRNGFADGFSAMGGTDRPNPRFLSNRIFGQDGLLNDPLKLSDYCWVFGQFLDHDITLTGDSQEPAMIDVPTGDPWFDPMSSGEALIFMNRSKPMEGTGTDMNNPRQFANEITAFIDGSNVYGSDEERASYLRSFVGGKLRVSEGNLLPFNTIDGEFASEIDPNAPHMDNPVRLTEKIFVAGDPRANENPLLTSFHTLFVREHNRICDELAIEYPEWDDEQLYQHARKLVGGLLQAIVYEQYLPAMGVHLERYQGYDPAVDPAIFNVFAAAAFRMGHTLLNSRIRLINNDGAEMPNGDMTLKQVFFNPLAILDNGGIDPFFKGMGTQIQQDLDNKVIDDVRNFLFGPPGAGGLDLAAININRGRDRGLPDFNSIREDFGLDKYRYFIEINPNPEVFVDIQYAYFDLNNIDPWVGMLAENHMPGALFGETVMAIMTEQFRNLRDGDRFYYENDPSLSVMEKNWIRKNRLVDVLRRNTSINIMQENVFYAMSHEVICAPIELTGQIVTEAGFEVENVEISLVDTTEQAVVSITNGVGKYNFSEVPKCDNYILHPTKNENPLNGVTTFDLIVILKHILSVEKMNSPYQILAADINRSGNITTGDLIQMRKLILGQQDNFSNNTSWRFVDADYVFPDPSNPFLEDVPESVVVDRMLEHDKQNFIAIKVGDVNNSNVPNEFVEVGDDLLLTMDDMQIEAGQTYTLPIQASNFDQIAGYQFTLNYDQDALSIEGVSTADLTNMEGTNFHIMGDAITTSWNGKHTTGDEMAIFNFTFKALNTVKLSEVISLDSRYTIAEAYRETGGGLQKVNVDLAIINTQDDLVLYQNQPNPFRESTQISFDLLEESDIRIVITDLTGKLIAERQGSFGIGNHQITFLKKDLNVTNGIYYYHLYSGDKIVTRKMIIQ